MWQELQVIPLVPRVVSLNNIFPFATDLANSAAGSAALAISISSSFWAKAYTMRATSKTIKIKTVAFLIRFTSFQKSL
jgi:mevalonate pyrophosphate decarboxylase